MVDEMKKSTLLCILKRLNREKLGEVDALGFYGNKTSRPEIDTGVPLRLEDRIIEVTTESNEEESFYIQGVFGKELRV